MKTFFSMDKALLYCGEENVSKGFTKSYRFLHFYWIIGPGHLGCATMNVHGFTQHDIKNMAEKCAPEDNGLVRKAVRAAEAEARTTNTPVFAIRAVGDALAEVVKTAALEEYKKFTAEEAAVTAASTAASTVINTADTVAVARNTSNIDIDSEI